jgi:hypothetical protein
LPYTESRGRRLPIIPVRFTYLRTTRPFDGLVDSGAERSICSVRMAEEAGINVVEFPVRTVRGVSGMLRARLCPIDLTLLGRRVPVEILVVEPNIVLLGRHDIFRAFQFGFDERSDLLLVDPY